MHQHFEEFVDATTKIIKEASSDESRILERLVPQAKRLVQRDDWLPDAAAVPHPTYYQQHLLYRDPDNLFSVVSFVWGPGQSTPIHNHRTWGVIAMLRGAENGERYEASPDGGSLKKIGTDTLHVGDVDAVSPIIGDIHRVENAFNDRVSISIHIYGGNIGAISRHVFSPEDGTRKDFVSGYANADKDFVGYAY